METNLLQNIGGTNKPIFEKDSSLDFRTNKPIFEKDSIHYFRPNKPIFEKDSFPSLVVYNSNRNPVFKEGKSYAWRVQAKDKEGKTVGRDDGWSESFVFKVYNEPKNKTVTTISISPSEKRPTTNSRPSFTWEAPSFSEAATYTITLRELDKERGEQLLTLQELTLQLLELIQ